jgi:basic amino acid/polyamine antiporter, APA family
MGLWSKKNLDVLMRESEGTGDTVTLKRTLGAMNLTLLGIGAIIGAGIFVLTGTAAAQYAGPAIVLSFVLAGAGCLFAGLCYAEFASMIPIAGSAYTYGYATLGELVAWIIGWDLILEYLFAASTVSVGWSANVVAFLKDFAGIELPAALTSAPFVADKATGAITATGAIINLPAVLLIGVLTTMLVIGIQESARLNNLIVFIKVAIVFLVIGFGFMYVTPSNWVPFIPENTGTFGEYGWSGIVRASGVIFFAYIGFDAVSTAAQEAKNPQRDLPIGILASLAVCTVLYILMALVMTGVAHYSELNVANPVYVAIAKAGPALAWLKALVGIGTIAGLASVVLVMLLGQPRIFLAMSRDGLLPPIFGRVHPRYQTPYLATIITGVVAGVIAGADRYPGRIGIHRNAAGLCYRQRGGTRSAVSFPQPAPAIPDAVCPRGPGPGHPHLRVHDVGAPWRHLAAVADLARDRDGHLLRVRSPSFQGGPRGARGAVGS